LNKVIVVGAGYWGKNLVRNFYELGVLAGVAEANDSLRSSVETQFNCTTFKNFSEALVTDIDALVIATPAETHYSLVKEALEKGKDVFVEKPLALTYQQGKELLECAQKNQRILMVGHVLEYHPAIQTLHKLIQVGELGQVRYLYSNRLSLGKLRREENVLWSFAPHDVAVILRMVGHEPTQVVACGGHYVTPNIADITTTNLYFENDIRAHIFVSWLHPFKEQRLVVIGEKKMASFDDVYKKLTLYDQRVEVKEGQPIPIKGEGVDIGFAKDEPLRLECQAFLETIQTRTPPITDGKSGLQVLRVLEAAQRSLTHHGTPVMLSSVV
jgi:predicted dehydrogenase